MLADLAERQSFALIDPESGKLLKAWLFLVATGNCGGGGSNVKRVSDLLLGMKRGQASARDLPLEYTVDQVTCSRGAHALAYGLVQPSALGGRYLDKAEP